MTDKPRLRDRLRRTARLILAFVVAIAFMLAVVIAAIPFLVVIGDDSILELLRGWPNGSPGFAAACIVFALLLTALVALPYTREASDQMSERIDESGPPSQIHLTLWEKALVLLWRESKTSRSVPTIPADADVDDLVLAWANLAGSGDSLLALPRKVETIAATSTATGEVPESPSWWSCEELKKIGLQFAKFVCHDGIDEPECIAIGLSRALSNLWQLERINPAYIAGLSLEDINGHDVARLCFAIAGKLKICTQPMAPDEIAAAKLPASDKFCVTVCMPLDSLINKSRAQLVYTLAQLICQRGQLSDVSYKLIGAIGKEAIIDVTAAWHDPS